MISRGSPETSSSHWLASTRPARTAAHQIRPTKTCDERPQEHHSGDRAFGHGAHRVAVFLRHAAIRKAAADSTAAATDASRHTAGAANRTANRTTAWTADR